MNRDRNELPEWFGTFALIISGVFALGFGWSALHSGPASTTNSFGVVAGPVATPTTSAGGSTPVVTTPVVTTPAVTYPPVAGETIDIVDGDGNTVAVPKAAYTVAEQVALAIFNGEWDGIVFADGGEAPVNQSQLWPGIHVIGTRLYTHTDTLYEIVFTLATDSENTDLRRAVVDVLFADGTWVYYRK